MIAESHHPEPAADSVARDVAYYFCSDGRRTTFLSGSSSAASAINQSGQPFHE